MEKKKQGPQIEIADGLRRKKIKTQRENDIPNVYMCEKKRTF